MGREREGSACRRVRASARARHGEVRGIELELQALAARTERGGRRGVVRFFRGVFWGAPPNHVVPPAHTLGDEGTRKVHKRWRTNTSS